jgi:FkbM family methyltransferase
MKVHGVIMDPAGCRVCVHVEKDGNFEPESVAAWRAALRPGEVALDIGAYTGLYALVAAKAGARAVAFEPNPVVFYRLRANITRNRLNVAAYTQAVSDKAERRNFYTRHDMTSAGRFKPRPGADCAQVDCVTVDSLAACRQRVAAVKIDVEGAELAVLRGAAGVLRRDHPLVIAEALTEARRDSLVSFMTGHGYQWRPADGRNLIFFT